MKDTPDGFTRKGHAAALSGRAAKGCAVFHTIFLSES